MLQVWETEQMHTRFLLGDLRERDQFKKAGLKWKDNIKMYF
jgi:hypothetical protein